MKTTFVRAARDTRGFTLVEILVVVAIVGVLASLLAAQAVRSIRIAHEMKTVAVALELKNGINGYELDYNRFPLERGAAKGDEDVPEMLTDGSNRLVDALLGRATDINPTGTAYVELNQAKGDRAGIVGTTVPRRFHDMWGQPYRILLDTNRDQQVKNPDTGNNDTRIAENAPSHLPVRVAVYSAGYDGLAQTKDDVVSWRK